VNVSARRLLCSVFAVVAGVLAFASASALAAAPEVTIEGESSTVVSATEARLEATIDPGGSQASYRPDRTFATPAAQGTGSPSSCPNEQRRIEQPYGLTLPDCRAYEMVSPLETLGNDATDSFRQPFARASVSGDAVTYASGGAFAEPTGTTIQNQYVSRRGPEGWSTQAVTPLHDPDEATPFRSYETIDFTPELTEGVADTNAQLTSEAPGGESGQKLYVDDFAGGSYRYVGGGENGSGSSEDMSHVVFGEGNAFEWVNGKIVPVSVTNRGESMAASIGSQHYFDLFARERNVWHAVSADGSRVYFTSPADSGYNAQTGSWPTPGTLYVRKNAEAEQSKLGVNGECTEPAMACTVDVSASQKTNGAGPNGVAVNGGGENVTAGAHYWGASADGARVFFTSDQELTNDATTGTDQQEIVVAQTGKTFELTFKGQSTVPLSGEATIAEVQSALEALSSIGSGNVTVSPGGSTEFSTYNGEGHTFLVSFAGALAGSEQPSMTVTGAEDSVRAPGADLYEYDLESGKLNDLSADASEVDGAKVLGVVQISEDGSYVYFVADGDLAGKAVAGQPNLYVVHDGGAPSFIATLSSNDTSDWHGGVNGAVGADESGPEVNTAVLAPNGGRLAFLSEEGLTGYDNEQAEPGECEGKIGNNSAHKETGECMEVFLYDAETGELACASCNPSGARPVGPSSFTPLPELEYAVYRPHDLLEDGSLFFDSGDELVPHASDGRVNVYEYENGQVYPISDVAGGYESFFLDASPSGNDVFFASADQLLAQDMGNNVVDSR
jgi:WD40-like Beta Propeller Repeat